MTFQTHRRIRVLHALPRPDGTTQYVDHMIGGAPADLEILTFSWRTALLGRYDVLHLHWPEHLVRSPDAIRRLAKHALAWLLVARLRLSGIPVVRTLHNLQPHEGTSPAERLLFVAIARRTAAWVRLNPVTPLADGARGVTIPHGHYRDVYREVAVGASQVPGRLLQFGQLRPYKGTERLLEAFRAWDEQASLRIVGEPWGDDVAAAIATASAEDPRVTGALHRVSDERLATEIREAELVVLPYRDVHNSGAALLALSLDRPVLMPRNPATSALAEEVGHDWVYLFDGDLAVADLAKALTTARQVPSGSRPSLSERDWGRVGERHAELYRSLAGARSPASAAARPGPRHSGVPRSS